jgi:hypothetical protein
MGGRRLLGDHRCGKRCCKAGEAEYGREVVWCMIIGMTRSLAHCTAHALYEHDCPYCRDAEAQVARFSDVKSDQALAEALREYRDLLRLARGWVDGHAETGWGAGALVSRIDAAVGTEVLRA